MSYKRIIKNLSGSTKQILNRDIDNGDQYDIPSHLWLELIDNTEIHTLIATGDYIVNDGEYDLPIRQAIGLIRFNQSVVLEHYTLVQEDGELIGNGQKLFLHDEDWNYDDEGYEEDQE